jgi:NitT/TauT family transport system ATP-binding protein
MARPLSSDTTGPAKEHAVEPTQSDAMSAPAGGGPLEPPPAIHLEQVSKTFRLESGKTVEAVRGIDLEIPKGDFVCLLGPSGHGKSTLLNMLAGFMKPTSGVLRQLGKPITGPGPERGVVFQRDTLFLWKRVEANVEFGLKARGIPKENRKQTVQHYLELTGLESFAKAWPKQLSGGMRRRVAIAMVFANEPQVLLMDEPFVGLDIARRADLYAVLQRLHQESGCTVVFITHEIDEALTLGDRLLVMVRGQVALDEPIPLARPRGAAEITSPEAQALKAAVINAMSGVVTDDER